MLYVVHYLLPSIVSSFWSAGALVEGLYCLLCGVWLPSRWRWLQRAAHQCGWSFCWWGKVEDRREMRAKPNQLSFWKPCVITHDLLGSSACANTCGMFIIGSTVGSTWSKKAMGTKQKVTCSVTVVGKSLDSFVWINNMLGWNHQYIIIAMIIPNPSPCTSMSYSTISLALCPARRSCPELFPSTWPSSVLGPGVQAHPVPSGGNVWACANGHVGESYSYNLIFCHCSHWHRTNT